MKWTDEVKQALEDITIGKWGSFHNGFGDYVYSEHENSVTVVASNTTPIDANFIVNAPTWLSQLLQEREQMVETLKNVLEAHDFYTPAHQIAKKTLKQVGELE